MEFLLYKKEKQFFTTTQHICNMCVFQYTCIVYISFALMESNPDSATDLNKLHVDEAIYSLG